VIDSSVAVCPCALQSKWQPLLGILEEDLKINFKERPVDLYLNNPIACSRFYRVMIVKLKVEG